ncbi:MAG: Acriflavin resistance plasma rane protein [Gammaproteobacteria bacterium]|jgi:hydrophobe/amphiphile efflux-1 (HAE1) family protein|nr:Acriflavin resistance plasma rane protein [Gammaproteobacteria bacterium]
MRLSEICIERPVLATVLSLALIVFGYIGYTHMETRYFPYVDEPYAQVSVHYDGASPDLMESQVTSYLENALINVDGVSSIASTSTYNYSHIYLNFEPGSNMIKEMGDVRTAVSSVTDKLPPDADPAVITSGGVERPVLNIGFMDSQLSPAQIRDYITQAVVPTLLNLPGMGGAWIYGANEYAMRVWLDPQKMAALGVTVMDIQNTLQSNNINFSGGSIQGKDRTHSIVANTQLHTPEQFANLIVRDNNGQIIRLKDVADVELGSSSLQDSPMRINAQPGIDLELRPLNTANPIVVADEAKEVLAHLHSKLPDGMKMLVTYDQSIFLKKAIQESFSTLFEAIILVMLVVFLFLGSIRAALVPIATIPVCVIGVFGVMMICGFSVNVMTLLAIILAIGLVVDDAIVVLENIHRHIEEGLKPMEAAFTGSKEIGFSVIAMTLTLAAVYAPTGFIPGFSATVFREFAFTLAGAVLISGFVALTLSPMMCSRVLMPHEKLSRLELALRKIFHFLNSHYERILSVMLLKRWLVVMSLCVVAMLGYFVYLTVPQSFIPKEDIGYFNVNIQSPPGSTIDYTDGFMRQLEGLYQQTPEILSYASFIFAGSGTDFVTMQPWQNRDLSTDQVIEKLMPAINQIPILIDVSVPDPINYGNNTSGAAVQVHLMTTANDYVDLQKTVDKLVAVFSSYPGMTNVNTSLKFDNQVYNASFKRPQAAGLNVNLQDVADTISVMLAGRHITDIQEGDQMYPVLVQMNIQDLSNFDGFLNNTYVRNADQQMIPLSNLVNLTSGIRQSNLNHYDRMRSADITAEIAPHYDLGQVTRYIQQQLDQNLTSKESYAFDGLIQAYLTSAGTMLSLFALSLVFIYLVLAAQFESFVDPLVILLSVPLCIVGALCTLKLTGGSLNLYTNIGLITLVGLITKHGILITQFANVRLKGGDSLIDAIKHAAVIRLRPILMTTCAMVLGAIPLAFATGPGSVSHQQIGWVIVGGMVFGTFFSLIVVPVAYYILAPFDHKKKEILLRQAFR